MNRALRLKDDQLTRHDMLQVRGGFEQCSHHERHGRAPHDASLSPIISEGGFEEDRQHVRLSTSLKSQVCILIDMAQHVYTRLYCYG